MATFLTELISYISELDKAEERITVQIADASRELYAPGCNALCSLTVTRSYAARDAISRLAEDQTQVLRWPRRCMREAVWRE